MAEVQVHAMLPHVIGQFGGDLRIEAVQQSRTAHEQLDLAAQGLQHAGQFHGHVPATDNSHAPRRRAQAEEVVGHLPQHRARDCRPRWPPARGDQQVLRTQAHAVGVHHGARIQQPSMAGHQHHAAFVQPPAIAGMDARDVALAMDDELLPVQRRRRRFEPQRRGQRDLLRELGRQPHRLLRYATDIDTGAAQFPRLQEGHARTVRGRAEGAGQSAGAAPDHDQVEVLRRHAKRSGR